MSMDCGRDLEQFVDVKKHATSTSTNMTVEIFFIFNEFFLYIHLIGLTQTEQPSPTCMYVDAYCNLACDQASYGKNQTPEQLEDIILFIFD